MIGIHPVHRRLAEIHIKAEKLGNYDSLSHTEKTDIVHCLQVNAKIVRELDELKNLSFVAHQANDIDWQHKICLQIDELEVKMI